MTPRPTFNDPRIVERVAEETIRRVKSWLPKDDDGEGVEESIRDMLDDEGTVKDGYAYCRYLESHCGWDPDSTLVDLLDGVNDIGFREHGKLVREWAQGWTPRFKPGDRVRCKVAYKQHGGTVVSIRQETAEYCVRVEALGHVEGGIGTHGIIVADEVCEAIQECEA